MTRTKPLLPIAVALLILGLGVLLVPPALHFVTPASGSSKTIALIGYDYYGWNYSQPSGANPTIRVTEGDSVTMKLSSGDTITHQFLVDVDNDGGDISDCSTTDVCSSAFSSSTAVSFTFTVNLAPGTYTYYCHYHPTSMYGSFIVLAPTTPDFSISSSPTSLTFLQASSGTSTITVTSQNGFSGTINLSSTASPTGPTVSLNPSSVSTSSGNPGTSTLTLNSTGTTPAGSYTITVTGSNATTSHTASVSLTINAPPTKDFSISSSSNSFNVGSGSTGTATITLRGVNGFTGIVALTDSVSPSGPTASFNPSSLTISGQSATSTLTVSAVGGIYSPVSDGTYSVTVTATSGSLSHTTTIQVTVGSSSSSSPVAPLSSTVLIAIVVVIVAAVAITVYFVKRKPSK